MMCFYPYQAKRTKWQPFKTILKFIRLQHHEINKMNININCIGLKLQDQWDVIE